ncbi:MAG: SDR family oxidoreductase [Candidatus Sericytochromatia bacterium]
MENNNDKKLQSIVTFALAGYGTYKLLKTISRPSKKEKLKGSSVIITGASAGIGKAYAFAFAEQGCDLILAARSKEKIDSLAEEIRQKYNVKVLSVPTDVSDEEQAKNLINIALEQFDHIDILINNAGIGSYGYIHETSISDMKKIMDVNFWGMVHCTHSILPSMIRRRKGRIVNVSSVVGKIALPTMGAYSATKFAMEGFSDSLRVEMKKYGIGVTVICPTSTKTDFVGNAFDGNKLKDDIFGMSSERVAKETINAILDNKREHILGIGENIGVTINSNFPNLIDNVLTLAPKFILKE